MTIKGRLRTLLCAGAFVLMLGAPLVAFAQDEAGSKISGSMSFDANTNFMSYGLDVWGTGTFDDIIFNPSFGLEVDLGGGFTANTGFWFDWNNNALTSGGAIGEDEFAIQETDVWVGVGYAYEKFSTSVTYQEWMYAGDSERILDVSLGYDTLLSPTFLVHARVEGNGLQEEGAVFVLGGSHGLDAGPVSLSIPINVAFVTEDYYVDGEGGFAYFSAGIGASMPLGEMIPAAYGDWAFNLGGTYYYTDEDVIGNPDDSIFTLNFGIGVGF